MLQIIWKCHFLPIKLGGFLRIPSLYALSGPCLLSSQEIIIIGTITHTHRLCFHTLPYSSPLLHGASAPIWAIRSLLLKIRGGRYFTSKLWTQNVNKWGRHDNEPVQLVLGNVYWFPSELWPTQLHSFAKSITEASSGMHGLRLVENSGETK